jgi:hypothetical protein
MAFSTRTSWPSPDGAGQSPRWLVLICLVLVFSALLVPRLLDLGRFATPDEHLWLDRSANFYTALTHRDFASTYQKEHPGVTVMWAGTLGFLVSYPEYRGSGLGQVDSPQLDYYLRKVVEIPPLSILVWGRFFIALFISLSLALAYLYAWRLLGFWAALLGFLLLAFEPMHLGLSRILHLDGLLSSLVLLSILALAYHMQYRDWLSLLVSGAAAGLSWLTKSPGFFLIPIAGLLGLFNLWRLRRPAPGSSLFTEFWKHVRMGLVWALVACLVFVALWPAMWVQPVKSVTNVFSKAQHYAEEGHESAIFFNGTISEDGRLGIQYFYFYPLTYVWRATPPVLIGLLLGLLAYFATRRKRGSGQIAFLPPGATIAVVGLLITVIVFTVGFTIGAKKFDRYLLPVYPPLDLLAALGWVWLGNVLQGRFGSNLARWVLPLGAGLVLVSHFLFTMIGNYPYYLTYYNPLLGGPQAAEKVLQIGWGEGLDEAARYLNAKPGSEFFHVMSWYSLGSFSYFSDSHVRYLGSRAKDSKMEDLLSSDYVVIYVHEWQRDTPTNVVEYLRDKTPEYIVKLNGLEYAWIYKIR